METRDHSRSGWALMSEGLVSGVHHALNNRMAALRAVGQVLETDLPANHPLGSALTDEMDRMEKSAKILALLGTAEPGPLPTQIDGLVEDVEVLYALHHDLRDTPLSTEVESGLLPVLVHPASLLRATLLALASVAPRSGTISLHVSGDERIVRIRIKGDSTADELAIGGVPTTEIKQEAERGGAVAAGEAAADGTLEIELLTLPEARRREKESGG